MVGRKHCSFLLPCLLLIGSIADPVIRYNNEMIGSILVTKNGSVLLYDVNTNLVINQTFPSVEQLPKTSALWHTARMSVIDNNAYIGGRDGIVFNLTLPINFLKTVSTGGSVGLGGSEDDVELTFSNITLPFSCINEVFTDTVDGVISACFSYGDSRLYVTNIHSPFDTIELQFAPDTDFSNVLPVADVFYIVQYGHLLRADVARGQRLVETLEDCDKQAWLEMNEYYYIIIKCVNKSIVYIPEEWSDAKGIKNGAWKNRNVELRPCYGIGFTLLVFSVDDTMITFYNIQNNFKKNIALPGNPDTDTLTCTWNNGNLTLIYKNKSCDCWTQHQVTERYVIESSSIIPYSDGTLSNQTIDQGVLLFHPTHLLLPSAHQVFLDLHKYVSHPMITDDVILFHAGIYSMTPTEESIIPTKENSDIKTVSDTKEISSSGTHWSVYLGVALAVAVFIVLLAFFGVVVYKRRYHIYKVFKRDHLPTEECDSESGIPVSATESQ